MRVMKKAKMKIVKCVICQQPCEPWPRIRGEEPPRGYGNNPWPVRRKGRCCDECNARFVIPLRIVMLNKEGSTPNE